MRILLLSVAFLGFTFAGVIAFLWALTAVERNLVGIALGLVLFTFGVAFYRRATGRTAFDLGAGLRRLIPKRSWATWPGAALVFVGLVASGFDSSITPSLVIWTLAGVLIGFGADESSWGRRVILLPLVLPSAAVFVMAMLMAGDAATFEAFPARDLAQAMAALWLVLVVTAGPGCLVGVGIHRLLLRLGPTPGPAGPSVPSGSRP